MAEIISLSKVRKAKARTEKEAAAEANRQKFGRTKGEKLKDIAEKSSAEKHLDGHKLEDCSPLHLSLWGRGRRIAHRIRDCEFGWGEGAFLLPRPSQPHHVIPAKAGISVSTRPPRDNRHWTTDPAEPSPQPRCNPSPIKGRRRPVTLARSSPIPDAHLPLNGGGWEGVTA